MFTLTLELTARTLCADLPLVSVWAQRLQRNATPGFPHPTGRRWGWHREDGELALYLGGLHLILSPRRGQRRGTAGATGAVTAPTMPSVTPTAD